MAAPLIGLESQEMAILLGAPIPAGMQGARHNVPTDVPSSSSAVITTQQLFPMDLPVPPSLSGCSSEILDPEIGSPPDNSVNMHPSNLPVEAPSIQLFGITITPHVEKSATDGASDEVNEVSNGVVDENVEGDV